MADRNPHAVTEKRTESKWSTAGANRRPGHSRDRRSRRRPIPAFAKRSKPIAIVFMQACQRSQAGAPSADSSVAARMPRSALPHSCEDLPNAAHSTKRPLQSASLHRSAFCIRRDSTCLNEGLTPAPIVTIRSRRGCSKCRLPLGADDPEIASRRSARFSDCARRRYGSLGHSIGEELFRMQQRNQIIKRDRRRYRPI